MCEKDRHVEESFLQMFVRREIVFNLMTQWTLYGDVIFEIFSIEKQGLKMSYQRF